MRSSSGLAAVVLLLSASPSPVAGQSTGHADALSADCTAPEPEGWDLLNTCDGLPDDWAVDVAADGSDLWVAFERAISHFDGDTWTHYPLSDYYVHDIHSVTVSDGTVYFATYGGLGQLDEDGFLKLVDGGNGSARVAVQSLEPGDWGERIGSWGPDEGSGVWYTVEAYGALGSTDFGLHFYNTETDRIITVDEAGLLPVAILQPDADQLWLKRPNPEGETLNPNGIEDWGRRQFYGDRWFNNAEYLFDNIDLCLENATALAASTYGPPEAEFHFLLAPYQETEFGDCDLASSARIAGNAATTRPRMARYDGSTWTSSRITSARRAARTGTSVTELEGPYRQVLVTPYGRVPLDAPEREWSVESEWWGTTWVVGSNGVAYSVHVNWDESEWQDDDGWAQWTLLNVDTGGLPSDYVTSVAYTDDGRVWIGTPAGLAVYTLEGEPVRAALSIAGPEGWHMLAAPVGGATVGGLLGPVWTQGFLGSDAPQGGSNVLLYNEAAVCDTDGGTDVPPCDASTGYLLPGAASDGLPSGAGVFAYLFADDDPTADGLQGGFPKALSVTGFEPELPFAFPALSYTDAGGPAADGWNLVGNPIAGALDWDAEGWTKMALSNTVYTYDPASDEYLTWNGFVGTLGSGVIPAGRGFWVQATAPDPALVAPEAARAATATREAAETVEALELRLNGTTASGERGSSVFFAFGVEGAAVGADPYDAYALVPPSSAYVLASAARPDDGEPLATVALPLADDALGTDGLEFGVTGAHVGLTSGEMMWTWSLPEGAGWTAVLVDMETGKEVDLATETEYAFAVDVEGAADAHETVGAPLQRSGPGQAARLGGGAGRFVLRIARSAVSTERAVPTEFAVEAPTPNPVHDGARVRYALPTTSAVEVAVYDLLGRKVIAMSANARPPGYHAEHVDAGSLAAGVYVVRTEVRPVGGEPRLFVHKMTVVR